MFIEFGAPINNIYHKPCKTNSLKFTKILRMTHSKEIAFTWPLGSHHVEEAAKPIYVSFSKNYKRSNPSMGSRYGIRLVSIHVHMGPGQLQSPVSRGSSKRPPAAIVHAPRITVRAIPVPKHIPCASRTDFRSHQISRIWRESELVKIQHTTRWTLLNHLYP